jgi:hypothetical protein
MELDDAAVERIAREFEDIDLGDSRRTRRAVRVAGAMAKHPRESLPSALETDGELQAAYRLVNNEQVDFDDLLAGHRDNTVDRAREAGSVLVLHDTTVCVYEHADPKEIGYLPTGKAGIFVHTALVVDAHRQRRPLGVVHAEPYWRERRSGRGSRKRHVGGKEAAAWKDRESERWARGVQECHEQLGDCSAIHVMDREGDKYELFVHMQQHGQRFVVRSRTDRRLSFEHAGQTLLEVVQSQPLLLTREVHVSRREAPAVPRSKKLTPARPARRAELSVTAAAVSLRRPNNLALTFPSTLTLNVVHVRELEPPTGQDAIDWTLLTSEPIDTAEHVQQVIDTYRYRWLTEELYKAIKTGCLYEKRLFDTRHALLNILAFTLPIAVELLWMRARVADEPEAPASDIVNPTQIQVLRAMGHRPLSEKPTAAEALLAIAGLGGHLKRNGPPGWQVLHRGYQRLLDYTAGWSARRQPRTKRNL